MNYGDKLPTLRRSLIRRPAAQYCPSVDSLSVRPLVATYEASCWRPSWPRAPDEPSNLIEQSTGYCDLGELEDDVAAAAHDLRSDLDQLLTKSRQRPVLDVLRYARLLLRVRR